MGRTPQDTIVMLRAMADGDLEARERLWESLYPEVLEVARAQRRRWQGDWTMETRVLANEVFLKVFGHQHPSIADRRHFFALLSKAIRQILVNYSEERRAAKRGGDAHHLSLEEAHGLLDAAASDQVLDLHEALQRFRELDPRASEVVELRFFGGLTYEEVAETIGVSRATAVRDWEAARIWLHREIGEALPPASDQGDDPLDTR